MLGKTLLFFSLLPLSTFGQWLGSIENAEREFSSKKVNFNLAVAEDFTCLESITEFDIFNLLNYRNSMYEIHSWWPLLDLKGMNYQKLEELKTVFYLDRKNNNQHKKYFSLGYQTQTKSFNKDFWNRGERWFTSAQINHTIQFALTLERDYRETWIINQHINHLTGHLTYSPNTQILQQITLGSFMVNQGLGLTFSNGFSMKNLYSPFQALRLKNQIRPYQGFLEQRALNGITLSGMLFTGKYNVYFGERKLNAYSKNGQLQKLSSSTNIYSASAKSRFKNYSQKVFGFNFSKSIGGFEWSFAHVQIHSPPLLNVPHFEKEIRTSISFHKKWKQSYFQYEGAINQKGQLAHTLQTFTVLGGNHYLGVLLTKTPINWSDHNTTEYNLFNQNGGLSLQWSMENQLSFGKLISNYRIGKSNANLESLSQKEKQSCDLSFLTQKGESTFLAQWSQNNTSRYRLSWGRTFEHHSIHINYITGANDFLKNHYTGILVETKKSWITSGLSFGVYNAEKQLLYRPLKTILTGFPFRAISGRGSEIQGWVKKKIHKIEIGLLGHYAITYNMPNVFNIQFSIVYR